MIILQPADLSWAKANTSNLMLLWRPADLNWAEKNIQPHASLAASNRLQLNWASSKHIHPHASLAADKPQLGKSNHTRPHPSFAPSKLDLGGRKQPHPTICFFGTQRASIELGKQQPPPHACFFATTGSPGNPFPLHSLLPSNHQ